MFTKHTPKPQENESFNAGYGRSESFSQIVGVEVAGWEDGGHSLFKLVFIHGNFLLVITVGSILFLQHFLVGTALLHLVCMPMGVFVVGRAPVVCLAIPLLGILLGELAKGGLFLSFSIVLEFCPELDLDFVELLELFLVCCC